MSHTGVRSFDRSLTKANQWLNELHDELNFRDKQRTYSIFKAVLHALRDRLTIDEATDFAAHLPLILKAPYYEDLKPSKMPIKIKSKEEFFALVDSYMQNPKLEIDSSIFVPKIFKFLSRKISSGEIEDIKSNLPKDLADIWEERIEGEELKTSSLKIKSTAFADMFEIPKKYTCEGENINPPLEISGVPIEAKSLILIVDDPDAKAVVGHTFDHWIVANIDPSTSEIKENSIPQNSIELRNSKGENKYTGPCPPDQEHRYFFRIYALDCMPNIDEETSKVDVLNMIENHIIDYNEIIGTYELKEKK